MKLYETEDVVNIINWRAFHHIRAIKDINYV